MKSLQVVGPFYTNYSLARVNRGLALGLSKIQSEYDVKLYCDKESIDFYPSESDLDKKPEIKKIFQKDRFTSDVVIYNNFPKGVSSKHNLTELPGSTKLMYTAWEESIYPKEWVEEINENLHGMMTASSFTREILRKSGIKVPIKVVPNALDKEFLEKTPGEFKLNTSKNFKFLHLSTAKQRKGVDVLLKAYFEQFTKDDDVVLVIKSFPGPDNRVEEILRELKKENSPEVIHINNPDLTDQELMNLTNSVDCVVYPSRAEGFGLPILEAMYIGTPVIATGYSGYLDFASEENTYLIEYELEDAINSEFANIGAKWAEPSVEDLKSKMKYIYSNFNDGKYNNEILTKISKAKEAAKKLTWEHAAELAYEFVKEIEKIKDLKTEKCAIVTPFNSESGISVYAEEVFQRLEKSFKEIYYLSNKDIADRVRQDGDNVVRTWETGEIDFDESIEFLKEKKIDNLIIQYHSGSFFPVEGLGNLIKKSKDIGINVVVTMHSVRGPGFDHIEMLKNISSVDKFIILNQQDFDYVKSKNNNTIYIPHYSLNYPHHSKSKLRKQLEIDKFSPIIATHGLLNVNKGIPEVLDCISDLKKIYPNILYLAINAVSSNNVSSQSLYEKCIEKIAQNKLEENVIFISRFLNIDQIEILMEAADIAVFNYSEAGESASSAIRRALASKIYVLATNIKQFDDFDEELIRFDGKEDMKNKIVETLEGKHKEKLEKIKTHLYEMDVENIALEILTNI